MRQALDAIRMHTHLNYLVYITDVTDGYIYRQTTIFPLAMPLARRTRFGCQALTAGTVVRF